MSYLEPPPMPAPVIVMKDVGGFVTDYQNRTALYRASDREVRLHECRSACTLALSLPNVCVYPNSTLKFHLAYDPRNHETNTEVSRQLFESYPPAVQARLGTLTRNYKVLTGSELIKLGIRDCNEPRIMFASAPARKSLEPAMVASRESAPQSPVFAGLMTKMLSVFGAGGERGSTVRERALPLRVVAKVPASEPTEIPLPPERPAEFKQSNDAILAEAAPQPKADTTALSPVTSAPEEIALAVDIPVPQPRPMNLALSFAHKPVKYTLPKIITGGQPILPPGFRAYAEFGR